MNNQKVVIKLMSFDHDLIDRSVNDIIETAKKISLKICGPIPLPTKIKKFTILTSPHVDKDARDQYEIRIHKRLLIICSPTSKAADALMCHELSAGVGVNISVK